MDTPKMVKEESKNVSEEISKVQEAPQPEKVESVVSEDDLQGVVSEDLQESVKDSPMETFREPVVTGRLMFQFNDDIPSEMGLIRDYAPFSITLSHAPKNKKMIARNLFIDEKPSESTITFTSEDGKNKLVLFIETF